MKVLITGANGFIGSYLVRYFKEQGFEVQALIHKAYRAALPGVEYRQFDLQSFGSDIIPKDVDTVIHTAYIPYSKGSNSDEVNLNSTKRLLDISRKKKIPNFIFLSSFSAKPDALSHYGQNKWQLQQLFDLDHELVLRPGLVLGNGGLFQNMHTMIRNGKTIPMIGGGKQVLQTIFIEDLAKIIKSAVEHNTHGLYTVAEHEPVTMKDFNKEIASLLKKKVFFPSIPYFAADLVFNSLELFNIKTKIGKENYLGLKQMQAETACDSEDIFHTKIRDYKTSLSQLIK